MLEPSERFQFQLEQKPRRRERRASWAKSSEELGAIASSLCAEARSLEQLLLSFIKANFQLTCVSLHEEGVLCISIRERTFGVSEKEAILGYIFLDRAKLLAKYAERLIPKQFSHDRKTGAAIIDEAWYSKRDRRLRIRETSQFTPAAALEELLLSYALIPFGMAEVSPGIEEDENYSPRHGAKIRLRYMPPLSVAVLEEQHFVRLDALTRLVQRRTAKLELQELEATALH